MFQISLISWLLLFRGWISNFRACQFLVQFYLAIFSCTQWDGYFHISTTFKDVTNDQHSKLWFFSCFQLHRDLSQTETRYLNAVKRWVSPRISCLVKKYILSLHWSFPSIQAARQLFHVRVLLYPHAAVWSRNKDIHLLAMQTHTSPERPIWCIWPVGLTLFHTPFSLSPLACLSSLYCTAASERCTWHLASPQ